MLVVAINFPSFCVLSLTVRDYHWHPSYQVRCRCTTSASCHPWPSRALQTGSPLPICYWPLAPGAPLTFVALSIASLFIFSSSFPDDSDNPKTQKVFSNPSKVIILQERCDRSLCIIDRSSLVRDLSYLTPWECLPPPFPPSDSLPAEQLLACCRCSVSQRYMRKCDMQFGD